MSISSSKGVWRDAAQPHGSTSKERLVQRRWGCITLGAMLAAASVVGSAEAFWRSRGFGGSVADTPALWAWHRARINREGEGRGMALIGSSRILTGFSTDAFRRRYTATPVAQLGIPECSPLEILDDLAADTSFRGVVVCELTEAAFLPNVRRRYGQGDYIDHYHQRMVWSDTVNVRLEAVVQKSFCIRNPRLALDQIVLRMLESGELPEPAVWKMRFDRRQLADYQTGDIRRTRALTITKLEHWYDENVKMVPAPAEWLTEALRTEAAVQSIRSRGGQVAFVRFPSSGETWELENRHFPKSQYWDRFADATTGAAIHFQDVLTLAGTHCPDTSHLDYRGAEEFTNRLLDELAHRRVVNFRQSP